MTLRHSFVVLQGKPLPQVSHLFLQAKQLPTLLSYPVSKHINSSLSGYLFYYPLLYPLFQNQRSLFCFSLFFEEYVNAQIRMNKIIKRTVLSLSRVFVEFSLKAKHVRCFARFGTICKIQRTLTPPPLPHGEVLILVK